MKLFAKTKQKQFSEKEMQYYIEIIASGPWISTMNHPKFIVSNQKEYSICRQWIQNLEDRFSYDMITLKIGKRAHYRSLS